MDIFDRIEAFFEGMLERFSFDPRRTESDPPSPPAPPVAQPQQEEQPVSNTVPAFVGVTLEQLRKAMPTLKEAKATLYLPFLNQALERFEVTTPLRMAAFLAQVAHESIDLRYFEEIADGSAYEGRKDLGNVQPGDGKRFKGRGPIQLTGRDNYRLFGQLLGIDLENDPKRAADPDVGFLTAGAFWDRKGLNALADNKDIWKISARINGINRKTGQPNGIEDRVKRYELAKSVLGVV